MRRAAMWGLIFGLADVALVAVLPLGWALAGAALLGAASVIIDRATGA